MHSGTIFIYFYDNAWEEKKMKWNIPWRYSSLGQSLIALNILSCIKVLNNIYNKHNINSIDIYKSCHHGGGSTNTKEMCELMKAKYCIITNTARWLDTYSTYDNLKLGNEDVNILPTDFQKYIFTINDNITYDIIKEESLFITLKKD